MAMDRIGRITLAAALAFGAAPASGQEPVLALDPTLMTGWAGGEAARRQGERATDQRRPAAPKRKLTACDRALAGKWCPRKAEFRRKLGPSNRNYRTFVSLCAEAGY